MVLVLQPCFKDLWGRRVTVTRKQSPSFWSGIIEVFGESAVEGYRKMGIHAIVADK